MAPPSETLEEGKRSLTELVQFKRKRFRSSTQLLWDKLQGATSQLMLCESRLGLTSQETFIIQQCWQKLRLAKSCIDRPIRRPFSFWEIIHEVDALLLLILPAEWLAPQALEVLQKFDAKVTDPQQRELWLGTKDKAGPLRVAVQLLTEHQLVPSPAQGAGGTGAPLSPEELSRCRHVLQGASGILNQQVDNGFWQLSTNVVFQILSALLLLLLLVLWWVMTRENLQTLLRLREAGLINIIDPPNLFASGQEYFGSAEAWLGNSDISFLVLLPFIMFGVAGAVLSNMLSKEPFIVSVGATSRFYVYYLFVKPLIGAFAALFLLLVERSDVLLTVVILRDGATAAAPVSKAAVQIVVHSLKAAIFTIAMLSVTAGFFADRFLSVMMDRAMGLLFKQSEKAVTSAEKEKAPLLPPSQPSGGEKANA